MAAKVTGVCGSKAAGRTEQRVGSGEWGRGRGEAISWAAGEGGEEEKQLCGGEEFQSGPVKLQGPGDI